MLVVRLGRALAGGTGLGGHFGCQSSQHVFSGHQPPLARYMWQCGYTWLHVATRVDPLNTFLVSANTTQLHVATCV